MMTRSDVQELIRNAIDEVERAVGQLLKAHAARLLMALECAEVPPSPGSGGLGLPLDLAEERQEQDCALDGAVLLAGVATFQAGPWPLPTTEV